MSSARLRRCEHPTPGPFDHGIGYDPALAGMNDARLGALAAPHYARYQPHAAGAAVAGTAVIGQVDAVLQRCFQQQLAATRPNAIAIDGNVVTSCHCLVPEG